MYDQRNLTFFYCLCSAVHFKKQYFMPYSLPYFMPFSLLWCLQRETYASYAMCLVHVEKDILQKRPHRPSWNKKINLLFSGFNCDRQNPSNLKIAAVSYHYRHKQLLLFYKERYSLLVTTFTSNTCKYSPFCLVQNLLWTHISTRPPAMWNALPWILRSETWPAASLLKSSTVTPSACWKADTANAIRTEILWLQAELHLNPGLELCEGALCAAGQLHRYQNCSDWL